MRDDVIKLLLAYNVNQVDAAIGIINYIINKECPLAEFMEYAREVSAGRHHDNGVALKKARGREKRDRRKSRSGPLHWIVEPLPMPPVKMCECGGIISGMPLPGCETKTTGRFFYSECDTCSYWVELIKDGAIYIERGNPTGGKDATNP